MPKPVVSLIGRPNVGKSTLFNRIVGRREAIVDDQPGVTRDRKHASVEWSGHDFLLIDTGGYLPKTEDMMEKEIVNQAKVAIAESALIVFLVDGREGVLGIDEEIAQLLKKSGKAVLPVINKIDTKETELNAVEFYRLGLNEHISISASNGRGIGDFLDLVIDHLSKGDYTQVKAMNPHISLAVIGRPNVGKSLFVNAILGESKHIVTEIPGTTRDAIDTVFRYQGEEFLIIDTAGLRKKAKVNEAIEYYSTVRSLESIKRCDIAILIVDATTGLETQDKKILQEVIRFGKGIVLAVNKWDLIDKETKTAQEFERKIRDSVKRIDYLPIMFVSAKTRLRVFKVIDVAKSVHSERCKTLSTSVLNRFLQDVVAKYAPPSHNEREVKINYCTQVKSKPPIFAFFTNAPKAIKSNYRSYIENQMREKFGFFGVPLSLLFRKK